MQTGKGNRSCFAAAAVYQCTSTRLCLWDLCSMFVKVHKKLFGIQLEINSSVRASGIDKNAYKNMLQTHFYSNFDESASLWCRCLPFPACRTLSPFSCVCVFTIANACCKRNVCLINSAETNSNNVTSERGHRLLASIGLV